MRLQAPLQPGEYELVYLTAYTRHKLARAVLHVTPREQEPGFLLVHSRAKTAAHNGHGAVEIILDASGSMRQRLGARRRIEIAAATLTNLTSKVIPAGTPFALRVLGGEASACQTSLELPLRPLDARSVAARFSALEPKNGAKTRLAAALAAVTSDLREATGERLVVLLTDGEETCDGNPLAEIERLRASGVDVRVNIVGFAIDDNALAATFRLWADAGGGNYFEARDAKGLATSLSMALRPAFEVADASGTVVASGVSGDDAMQLLPGNYVVRPRSGARAPQTVTIQANRTTSVSF